MTPMMGCSVPQNFLRTRLHHFAEARITVHRWHVVVCIERDVAEPHGVAMQRSGVSLDDQLINWVTSWACRTWQERVWEWDKIKGVPTDTQTLIKFGQLAHPFWEIHHFNPSPFLELQHVCKYSVWPSQSILPPHPMSNKEFNISCAPKLWNHPQKSPNFSRFLHGIFWDPPVNSRSMLGRTRFLDVDIRAFFWGNRPGDFLIWGWVKTLVPSEPQNSW